MQIQPASWPSERLDLIGHRGHSATPPRVRAPNYLRPLDARNTWTLRLLYLPSWPADAEGREAHDVMGMRLDEQPTGRLGAWLQLSTPVTLNRRTWPVCSASRAPLHNGRARGCQPARSKLPAGRQTGERMKGRPAKLAH